MRFAYFALGYLACGLIYSLLYTIIFEIDEQQLRNRISYFIVAWPILVMLHAFLETISVASKGVVFCARHLRPERKQE